MEVFIRNNDVQGILDLLETETWSTVDIDRMIEVGKKFNRSSIVILLHELYRSTIDISQTSQKFEYVSDNRDSDDASSVALVGYDTFDLPEDSTVINVIYNIADDNGSSDGIIMAIYISDQTASYVVSNSARVGYFASVRYGLQPITEEFEKSELITPMDRTDVKNIQVRHDIF